MYVCSNGVRTDENLYDVFTHTSSQCILECVWIVAFHRVLVRKPVDGGKEEDGISSPFLCGESEEDRSLYA